MISRPRPDVHQDLVDQDECRQALLGGQGQQVHQKGLGRGAVPLGVEAVRVQELEAIRSGNLKCEYAPRVLQSADLSLGTTYLHAFLGVQLVEGQDRYLRARRRPADVLQELLDGGQVGQPGGVEDQVIEGDQRMRLAAAVGELKLPDCLVDLARQAGDDVLG